MLSDLNVAQLRRSDMNGDPQSNTRSISQASVKWFESCILLPKNKLYEIDYLYFILFCSRDSFIEV